MLILTRHLIRPYTQNHVSHYWDSWFWVSNRTKCLNWWHPITLRFEELFHAYIYHESNILIPFHPDISDIYRWLQRRKSTVLWYSYTMMYIYIPIYMYISIYFHMLIYSYISYTDVSRDGWIYCSDTFKERYAGPRQGIYVYAYIYMYMYICRLW
jgi:hypothetical protein